MSSESINHDAAKRAVAGWLRQVAEEAGYDRCASLGSLSWRVNRHGPSWGIYVEYPMAEGNALDGHWDEYIGNPESGFVPDLDWLVKVRDFPKAIIDVAVFSKGVMAYALEIVHKHPTIKAKQDFLHRHSVGLIELDARKVNACLLGQLPLDFDGLKWKPKKPLDNLD